MKTERMPVIFIGHGSPMNAIEDNEFSRTWVEIRKALPRPKAILSISAHWETLKPQVTAMQTPKTIHDFYGFPDELNEMQYPAPGSPELAARVMGLLADDEITPDQAWGLDHGTWSVLARMFPDASVPVVQLSLPRTREGRIHFDLGSKLLPLRDEGVLILGSGNVVHNLARIRWEGEPFDWAIEFDRKVKEAIEADEPERLIRFQEQGAAAAISINSAEHYLPLLYVLGARQRDDTCTFYCESVAYGSLSMRCIRFG